MHLCHRLPILLFPKVSRPLSLCKLCTKAAPKVKNDLSGKEHLNVGTIGHVDHGKTTLTSALTKYCSSMFKGGKYVKFEDIDKATQERVRGVTINASHVQYISKKRHYAHTDCPGHADYIKNMICGTSQMDAAILVVAASEGTMPQTREHVLLSQQIGLKQMVVYVNKCDLVDDEVKELVELEVRDLLDEHGFENEKVPFVFGSALLALNDDESEMGVPSIGRLLDVMDNNVEPPTRDFDGPLMCYFDSKLSVPGRGTVAIGTLSRGTVKKGDQVEIIGHGQIMKTVVTDIHVFGKSVPEAKAGDHIGLLLRNVKTDQLKRGMVIAKPSSLQMYNRYEASAYLLNEEEGGRNKPISAHYVSSLYSQTWTMGARVDVPSSAGGLIMPGDHGLVHITLAKSMVMLEGQKFTIRHSGNCTMMSGVISKPLESIASPRDFLQGTMSIPNQEYGMPNDSSLKKQKK